MRKMLGSHIRGNLVGYIALFFALSGGAAWATHPGGANTISTGDIQDNQVFSADVRNDILAGGGLTAADLRPGSVSTSEVAAESLGSGDLASSSVGTSEVAIDSLTGVDINEATLFNNNSLTGDDIADTNSLTGPEIDEASLEGVARTSGASGCCEIIGADVITSDPYSAADPDTFVDLGTFELRSPTSDNSAGSGFRLCNTSTTAGYLVFIYVGGRHTPPLSTADTRSSPVVGAGTCSGVDYNGADTDAFGDFRLHLPGHDVVVFGDGFGGASGGNINIFAIGQ